MKDKHNLIELIEQSTEKFELQKDIEIEVEVFNKENGKIELETAPLKIDKIFSPTKLKRCILEYITNSIEIKSKYSKNEEYIGVLEPYLIFMLIKHFSSLGEFMPTKIPEQVALMNSMIDSSVLFQIMMEFEVGEIDRAREEVEIILAVFDSNMEEVEQIKKETRKFIKNKDLLDF